ncbi:hypothetical protein SFUMM280S_09235 [Streptomyces fumanus]
MSGPPPLQGPDEAGLVAALARARSAEPPGPDTAATLTHLAQAVLLAVALAGLARGDTDRLPPLLGAVLAVVAARAALAHAQRRTATRAGAEVRVALRDDLLAHLGRLGPAHLTTARAGAVRTTLVDGVEGVDAYVSATCPSSWSP